VSEEARISSVIFDYAGKIGRAIDTDATLHLNAALARDLVGADRCSIWLIDPRAQQLWTKVAHGVEELRIPLGEGVIGACIAENRPIVVNDAVRDPRFHSKLDAKTGYATRSLLAIPLTGSNGNAIGALQVLNKPGGFDDRDVNLLGLAAAYSASAIEAQLLRQQVEASRMLQRELEIARGVQERLFPQQLPVCRGLDIAAVCRPARAVGGDYFDFIPLPGGELLFTLGDVSGKGIAAAVLMASIQASIRSQVLRPPESLAALVGDFNRAVFSLSTVDKYSTLFCGLLNPETRQLSYVNAAQVPPVVVRATGEIERLEAGGTAVGMFPAARYEQAAVNLEPGDAVVCFSDGISEAANVQDEMWDEAQYLALLQHCAHLTARGIVEALVAGADAFAGDAEQADDMTVVVLKAVSVAEKP
jgi:phosphoserine phosphatase RsbU/P